MSWCAPVDNTSLGVRPRDDPVRSQRTPPSPARGRSSDRDAPGSRRVVRSGWRPGSIDPPSAAGTRPGSGRRPPGTPTPLCRSPSRSRLRDLASRVDAGLQEPCHGSSHRAAAIGVRPRRGRLVGVRPAAVPGQRVRPNCPRPQRAARGPSSSIAPSIIIFNSSLARAETAAGTVPTAIVPACADRDPDRRLGQGHGDHRGRLLGTSRGAAQFVLSGCQPADDQPSSQTFSARREAAAHRPHGATEALRGLLVGQTLEVAQHDGGPVLFGQSPDLLMKDQAPFIRLHGLCLRTHLLRGPSLVRPPTGRGVPGRRGRTESHLMEPGSDRLVNPQGWR